VFDSLQEQKSMNDYGNLLGRMACMLLRSGGVEYGENSWLTDGQHTALEDIDGLLQQCNASDSDLDEKFHSLMRELFLWHESRRLIDSLDCVVHRFLVYASVDKGAEGFIHTREIGRLIAKLIFGVRGCIFKEFMEGIGAEREGVRADQDLGGLLEYATDLLQTPFGFLRETMHFAASVVGESGTLPQVSWLGVKRGVALAIHGKRVELQQLQKLCQTLLTKAKKQLQNKVKMGIAVKAVNWEQFDAEDDLTNIWNGYSFLSSYGNQLTEVKSGLLHGFMANSVTRGFFTRGINGEVILWKKRSCIKWLKECKKLLEMIVVLSHLLGGQPARSTELATLRWRNAVDEQRGVYWTNDTMMLLAMYTKTRSITGRNKLIPR
jgi:hypothetical protein